MKKLISFRKQNAWSFLINCIGLGLQLEISFHPPWLGIHNMFNCTLFHFDMAWLFEIVTQFNSIAIWALEYSKDVNYINFWFTTLFNKNFQIPSIEPQKQVCSAWLILLLPIGWLTFGKWCWLAVTICAIFPLLGGLLSVFVSKCSSELQLLWIRMLCYILLRSYIQCCT